jgi:hypothetical protein
MSTRRPGCSLDLGRVIALQGRDQPLAEVTDAEIGAALAKLWGKRAGEHLTGAFTDDLVDQRG